MYELQRIDLGKDEAEQDQRLHDYFLKTQHYKNALEGKKTIVVGRKGSGKSAIFTLMRTELEDAGVVVIPITPDQYSWSALKDYKEQGILPEQAHTNAWQLTLLSSVVWNFSEKKLISRKSQLTKHYQYLRDSYVPTQNWFLNIVEKVKRGFHHIKNIKLGPSGVDIGLGETGSIATPLRVIEDIKEALLKEWPQGKQVRILLDRLDDSWDASKEAQYILIGLLKSANLINANFGGKLVVTVFLRSDIYDNLFFSDQDKLRQNEESLSWSNDDLKAVVCERVRVSLELQNSDKNEIWQNLFSKKLYRSQASAEKYIIDRTFKRPRDIISFVRFALEMAIKNGHGVIEPEDTRQCEEQKYSQSKYKDLIIEHQNQFAYIKDLLDSFSNSPHKWSKDELSRHLDDFIKTHSLPPYQSVQLLRQLFVWGVIGIKRVGRAGVKQRGGAHFYYYYDDPAINPLIYNDYYMHPSLRHYLNISEKKERGAGVDAPQGVRAQNIEAPEEGE